MKHWILVGQTPVEVDLMEWGRWFETHAHDRFVDLTAVGGYSVSTVFLGIDNALGPMALFDHPDHVPELFETMIFGHGDHVGFTRRWRSYLEARHGHKQVVLALAAGRAP